MKTFTAKQFSRTPGVVFDAAREDGAAAITHGHNNEFTLTHNKGKPAFEFNRVKPIDDILQENEKGPEGPNSKQ